jgi:hypothetical protein
MFWSMYGLSFFDLHVLITLLASSHFSYNIWPYNLIFIIVFDFSGYILRQNNGAFIVDAS